MKSSCQRRYPKRKDTVKKSQICCVSCHAHEHTCAKYAKSLEHLLVRLLLDPLADQRSGLVDDEQEQEEERKLMYNMFIHDAVVDRFDADGEDQGQGDVPAIPLGLPVRCGSVEHTCCSNLHGSIVRWLSIVSKLH